MTERVTRRQLDATAARVASAARQLGIIGDDDRAALDIGSRTYGRAFRLWTVEPDSGGYHDGFRLGSDAFLGMTARDALQSLRMLAAAYESVLYASRTRRTSSDDVYRVSVVVCDDGDVCTRDAAGSRVIGRVYHAEDDDRRAAFVNAARRTLADNAAATRDV